jgi:hypothetical protein
MARPKTYETTCPDCEQSVTVDEQGLFAQHRIKPVAPDMFGGPASYQSIGPDNPWCDGSRKVDLGLSGGSVHGMQGGLPTLGKKR